jgi:hypothetical protein
MAAEELLMYAFCGFRACSTAPEIKAKPPYCPALRQESRPASGRRFVAPGVSSHAFPPCRSRRSWGALSWSLTR